MTRPVGFGQTADVATDLLLDDRVLDAVEAVGPVALAAYLAVVLNSWSRGERVTLSSAARRMPPVYGDLSDAAAALAAAGLLDGSGRIPATTWDGWYGPAWGRYLQRVESGRRGGFAKAANRRRASDASAPGNRKPNTGASDAVASLQETASDPISVALPDRPYDLPNGRSVVRGREDDDDPYADLSFADRLARHGLKPDIPPRKPNGAA